MAFAKTIKPKRDKGIEWYKIPLARVHHAFASEPNMWSEGTSLCGKTGFRYSNTTKRDVVPRPCLTCLSKVEWEWVWE